MDHEHMTKSEAACVSLKEFFEAKLASMDLAITLARQNIDGRLVLLNELRNEVVKDRALYATRELHDRLQADVSNLSSQLIALQSRYATWMSAAGVLFAVMQIAGSLILYFVLHRN